MHQTQALGQLARDKAAVRQKVARSRARCMVAASHMATPLVHFDHALVVWRDLSPLARYAAPSLGLLLQHVIAPRFRVLRTLLRWGPLAIGVMRLAASFGRTPKVCAHTGPDRD